MRPILIENSVTKLTAMHAGAVLVAGSHGGRYAGYLAAKAGVAAVILNDAGIGKDEAGIGALAYLEDIGIPSATVDAFSARIGDGRDMAVRGRLSHCNALAKQLGCSPGLSTQRAANALSRADTAASAPPESTENRFLLNSGNGVDVWGLDSAALVQPDDTGQVIVCGSHGAVLAGQKESALRVDAKAVCFHNAGIGIDDAGISRLPLLGERGIAAAAVDHNSACIGDARSLWDTGVLSHVNAPAAAAGARAGMTVQAFAALFTA